MDFNFLRNVNFNSYPEVSPLIEVNHASDPFYMEEEHSFFEPQPSSTEKHDHDNNHEFPQDLKKKENLEDSLVISPKISGIKQSNIFDKNEEEESQDFFQNLFNFSNTTTDKSKTGKIKLKEKEENKEVKDTVNVQERKEIFGLSTQKKDEILPRIDYAIKNFKVSAVKFIKDYGNKLVKDCKFKGELKNVKLFAPSNKYFTGISNEKDNKIFLDFTVENIFSYPDSMTGENNRLQQNNKNNIGKMKALMNNKAQIPKEYEELKHFFEMTFAEAIMLFYKSEKFLEYKEETKTKYLDSQFIKVKGFSLLEQNSFIDLMRHNNH